jgi:integrase
MRSPAGPPYPRPNGTYDVDTTYRRQRIRGSGFESHREAEDFLISHKQLIKSETTAGVRRRVTLDEAAAKYIQEQAAACKPSWGNDASMLRPVVAMKGSLTIDQLDDDSLADFVKARLDQGRKATTINRTLAVVRAICNRAATVWKFENGLTWLDRAPKITLLDEDDKRPPRPLAWAEQPRLLAELPEHLADMALFDLNTGVREDVVCSLRWEWEARVLLRRDLMISVFVVPRDHVKGRKQERVLICNSIAQRLVDERRGQHPDYVFTYPRPKTRGGVDRQPVQHMNNTAWQKARTRAGLGDLHVHDLRHTVGMRLRSRGVSPRTQDAILWHASGEMTDHYAIAQLREVYDALELITRPSDEFETLDLHALIRRTKMQRFTKITPDKEKAALQKVCKAA